MKNELVATECIKDYFGKKGNRTVDIIRLEVLSIHSDSVLYYAVVHAGKTIAIELRVYSDCYTIKFL